MSDKDRLADRLRGLSADEKLDELKRWHREAQRDALTNARDYDEGRKSKDETQEFAEACDNVKSLTEQRLKTTDKGKDYLYGPEAKAVADAAHQEDMAAKKKTADLNHVAEIEAANERNPPIQAAEVSAEELTQDSAAKSAEAIRAFRAEQKPKVAQNLKLQKAAELELTDEQKRKMGLGDEGLG